MELNKEPMRERMDSDILFSRSIKAGKRVYYLDVKRDRHGENYLSITESKRIKDGTDEERPVFEKHKIFLYREDMDRFVQSLHEAVEYARTNSPAPRPHYGGGYGTRGRYEAADAMSGYPKEDYESTDSYFSHNGFGQREEYERGIGSRPAYSSAPAYGRRETGYGRQRDMGYNRDGNMNQYPRAGYRPNQAPASQSEAAPVNPEEAETDFNIEF